jgi:hypothetical protein
MRLALTLTAVLIAPAAGADTPAGLLNARLETRSAAGGLEKEVRALLSSRAEPFWIGYAVASGRSHSSCCWSSGDDADRCCGGCRLESAEKGERAFRSQASGAVALEAARSVHVLARAEGGRVLRLRAYSADCALDAGGLPLVWLEGVPPAESVAWLSTLLERAPEASDDERHQGHGEAALAAIAFHADPSADAALERWAAAGQPLKRRRQAAFWMGVERGARGRDALIRLVRQDADPKFREHVVFALTRNRQPGAIEAVLEVARKDADPHVRGQALFWLAQTASRQARAAVRAAVDEDPEVEVKKKAVFALSQLPKDEGVPLLIGVARTHRSPAVRKQAMFWLGQSGDPRALAFFEEVLKR